MAKRSARIMLKVENLITEYGAVRALDGVSFTAAEGKITLPPRAPPLTHQPAPPQKKTLLEDCHLESIDETFTFPQGIYTYISSDTYTYMR
jgi:hypothetical protein